MKNLETNLYQIFVKESIQESLNTYFDIGIQYSLITEDSTTFYNDALNSSFRLKQMQNVYREDILRLVSLFHQDTNNDNSVFKLYAYLGEMVCYWFLGEYNLVKSIQNTVKHSVYSPTWWEENKKDILSVSGGALAGLAAFLTGGASLAVSGGIAIVGGRTLQNCISGSSKMEDLYNKLKQEIVAINFNV